jgi:hypothetical protein
VRRFIGPKCKQLFNLYSSGTGFSGKVIDSKQTNFITKMLLRLFKIQIFPKLNLEGKFAFKLPTKVLLLLVRIKVGGYKDQVLSVDVEEGKNF